MRPRLYLSVGLYFLIAVSFGAVRQACCDEISKFHLAVSKGELAKVKQLIRTDPTLVNRRNEYKFTPLFAAALSGHTSVAKLLLDRGAEIETRVLGQTPLYAACDNGHSETAALLLDRGADPNAARTGKDGKGETPLDTAIDHFHKETVKTLLEHGANPNLTTEEYKAAAKNFRKQSRQIPLRAAFLQIRHARHWKNLKKGDKARVAELDRLIKTGKEIARILITHQKTDVTARHPHGGGVALHLAAVSECPDLAKLLLARGVDVNVRTTKRPWLKRSSRPPDYAFNETPLHLAVRAGHEEMVKLLLKHGADRGAINSLGRTPFDLKAKRHHSPTRKVDSVVSHYLKSIIEVDSSAKAQWERPGRASMYLSDTLLAPAAPDKHLQMKRLRLEVEFEKRDYLLGEPIPIRCSLINNSSKPIVLSYGHLAEQKNTFFFEIIGPNGKPVPWQSPSEIDSDGPQPLPIPSGWRYVAWFNLVDHYNLSKASEFVITVRYESDGRSFNGVSVKWRNDLWKGKRTQKLGSLKIIEPTRPADKVALKDLLATARYSAESPFCFRHLFYAEKLAEKFDKFLRRHGHSRYAAYARYGNALRAIDRFKRTGRKVFAETAIPYLQAINPAGYPSLFAERQLFHLIQAHVATDFKPEQVDTLVQKFLADYPQSPYAYLLRKSESKTPNELELRDVP